MRSKSKDGSWVDAKSKKSKSLNFTFGQAIALAALCSSLAAVVTAFSAVYFFGNSLMDVYSDQLVASTTHSIITRHSRLRPLASTSRKRPPQLDSKTFKSAQDGSEVRPDRATRIAEESPESSEVTMTMPQNPVEEYEESSHPRVAWLMSFPNR